MTYPNNKQFAFTIIDDTDNADIKSIKPVYDFLTKLGLKTTKTVWVYPSRDKFKGGSLLDYAYRQYVKKLQKQGFEIALHSVGSGKFSKKEIAEGLRKFRQLIGKDPKIQINHSQNPDNLYWGTKRLNLLKSFWFLSRFKGDNSSSRYFWGNLAKEKIKFVRNFTFRNLNTLKSDPFMPYKDSNKPYVNYWFSASDGEDIKRFNCLVCPKNIDKLKKEQGASIVYTHFASGFVKNGRLNSEFQKNMRYLAKQDGWFLPAGEILEYLLKHNKHQPSRSDLIKLEFKWLKDKFLKKVL